MSRPSNPQPFAPTGASVQYEAPHGLLKLRGGHEQPGTSAYPELDEKGVSLFLFFLLFICPFTYLGSYKNGFAGVIPLGEEPEI